VLPILLACFIWLPAVIGLGWIFLCVHKPVVSLRPLLRLALSGVFGLLVLSVIGSFANFFVAVYPVMPICALVSGWIICAGAQRRLFDHVQRRHLIIILVLATMIAISASRGKIEYDTGLYHLTAVKWIASNPTPLGLANLYGRLGFNSSWFSAAAMLETPHLVEKSTFILNPLLFILLGLTISDAAIELIKQGFNQANLFLVFAAYPLAVYGFNFSSSLHPDLAVMLLICLVFAIWLKGDNWSMAVTLSIFALTIKLSAIPLLIAAIVFWLWRGRRGTPMAVILLWGITLSVWLVRGIILSGCLVYPSIVGRIETLSWTVPIARIQVESACIRDWARYRLLPWDVPTGAAWIWAWAQRVLATQEMLIAISLVLFGIVLCAISGRTILRQRNLPAILLASVGGIVYWFVTAPEPRFGYGYIFCFAALIFCIGFESIRRSARTTKMLLFASVILLVTLSGYFQQLNHIRWLGWPSIKADAVVARQIPGGPSVYVPKVADQIWVSPLPSTPYPDPSLRCEMDERGRFRQFWLDPSQSPMPVP
jgi:hypothetical protein